MKPAPFEYHLPDSIQQTLELLHEHGGDVKLLAGGQSLVPAMNFRIVQPSVLVDLNRIGNLSYIDKDNGVLRIGAMTRDRELEFDPLIADWAPLLAEAVPFIAHPQIRNRGTVGGSIVHSDPAAEMPVLMLALNARFKVRSSSAERWVDAADFFKGMFTTVVAPDEILVEIELPRMAPKTGWSFMEVAPRKGDYALMGVAVQVTLDDQNKCKGAKLVFLNAGDGPVIAKEAAQSLAGEFLNEKNIEQAALLASEKEITPYGNIHTSPEFQRHLANVLTRRALNVAAKRAKEGYLQ